MSLSSSPTSADASGPTLASFYERHMALLGGVAYGWTGRGQPARQRDGVRQVGVSRDAYFALFDDGRLMRWSVDPQRADTLMQGVADFAAGESGWFAIVSSRQLWHGSQATPQRVVGDVVATCIGDGADYYVRSDGTLWVKGLAHCGQYGDGRLATSPDFISTAGDAVAVKAHTGHAIYLRRDGVVLGTGAIALARCERTVWATRPTAGGRSSTVPAPLPPARAIRWRSATTPACGPGARVSASSRASSSTVCSPPRLATPQCWRSPPTGRCGSGRAAARHGGCNGDEDCRRAGPQD